MRMWANSSLSPRYTRVVAAHRGAYTSFVESPTPTMHAVRRADRHSLVSGLKTPETPQCRCEPMATAAGSAVRQVCFAATFGATPEFLRKLVTNSEFRSGARRAYSVRPRRIHADVPRRAQFVAAAGTDGTRSL